MGFESEDLRDPMRSTLNEADVLRAIRAFAATLTGR
jgi:hypothetical protein